MQEHAAKTTTALPGLDGARTRARGADLASRTLDYSRFVRVAKILLPGTAAGLVLLVILFTVLHTPVSDIKISLGELKKLGGQLEMSNPVLTYTDDKNRDFYVNADKAVQEEGGKDLWHLKSIRGRMTPPTGRGYKLKADRGLLDAAKKLLDLSGKVLVVSDEGYTFEASSAHVDMNKNTVTSEEPVRAHGGATTITSDRFSMWDKGTKVRFEGRVHFTSKSTPRKAKTEATTR